MSNYKIESGIPLPDPKHLKYPVANLKIGDSFLVPLDQGSNIKDLFRKVSSNSVATAKRHGFKIVSRTIKDEGVRVWRIE